MKPGDIIKLAEEIAGNLEKEMQEELDWKIMTAILKETNWKEVKIERPSTTAILEHQIKEWCRKNLKGAYHGRGRTWIFEKEQDAMWFTLKWS